MTTQGGQHGDEHHTHRPVTVALVNDYHVVIEQLREMLRPFADRVRVVDTEIGGTNVAAADIALFDTLGGQQHALARAKELAARRGVDHVLIYARAPSPAFVRAATAVGVDEVVDKSLTGEALVATLEAVANDRPSDPRPRRTRSAGQAEELTLRDRELVALLAKGLSNEQIAEELFVGVETARTHVRTLYRKLGMQKRTQAVEHAARLGLALDTADPAPTPGRRRSRHFRRQPPEVREARAFVTEELRRHGASDAQIDVFRLAVSELAANAVTHGNRSGWTVGVKVTREWLTLDVSGGDATSDDLIFHPERWQIADPDQPSGRGLGIVRELMDQVSVRAWRGHVRVACRLRREPA